MTKLILTSAQHAALNAAGEALVDLGLRASISYDPHMGEPYFCVTARCEETNYRCGSAMTVANAADKCLAELNELIENLPPKELRRPSEVVAAVSGILDDIGETAINAAYLREQLDALPVKD